MKIAIAKINCRVGDRAGNFARIIECARRSRAHSADLLVTPELALSEYPPEDLLLRDDFYRTCDIALQRLAAQVSGIVVVVGYPRQIGRRRYNAASVIQNGRIIATYHKHALPNYTVFDEERYFDSDDVPCVFEVSDIKFGVNICEDTWGRQGPLLANPATNGREIGAGGNNYAAREALGIVTIEKDDPQPGEIAPEHALEADVYDALCLGVRDYVTKNGFPGVLLGLSGGIDSALTLAIAADALGAGKVRALMLPSQYTASMSREDARAQAATLGVRYSEIAITPVFDAFLAALSAEFKGLAPDTTEENLQSRIRGTLLMSMSNKSGSIVLTTGNKSEMATGYATLYGDMAGGVSGCQEISKKIGYLVSECLHNQRR